MTVNANTQKLIVSMRSRNLKAVRALLTASGLNPNERYEGKLAIVEAASAGAEFVKAMLSVGSLIDAKDGQGITALLRASERGDVDAVKALLAANADPNITGGLVKNPLRAAASTRSPQHLEVLRLLIASGANIDIESKSKLGDATSTPLIEASRTGNLEAVRELLLAGANVNKVVTFGTALIRAAEEGHENVVRVLLHSGADPSIRVPDNPRLGEVSGKTALELGALKGYSRIAALLSPEGAEHKKLEPQSMADAWRRLEATLAARLPGAYETLNPGASGEDLLALAAAREERLPDTLEQFLKIHNGQQDESKAAFIYAGDDSKFRLINTSEIIREWRLWNDLLSAGEFVGRRVLADGGVRAEWYNRRWIPLTADGLGNNHCVDLSPTPGGCVGQIILLWHDQAQRTKIAGSIVEWLGDVARDLELHRTSAEVV